ncbi:MAG: hypothetical protein GC204_00735 [Chloroflexi bacterium]|nr:hypothetical protein [Chloroflexota bacterium]
MPELLDQQFEADIARTLKFDALVTPLHQEDARARLLRSAAEQIVLPPAEAVVPERAALREHAHSFRQWIISLYRFWLVDFTCYERARRPLKFSQYYNTHGRGAFTIIHVSA